jgi:transcription elongation factor SPT6
MIKMSLQDEYSMLVQQWNEQRSMALERALTQMLYPTLIREIKTKLLDEAKQSIIQVKKFC